VIDTRGERSASDGLEGLSVGQCFERRALMNWTVGPMQTALTAAPWLGAVLASA
jgi:hypothetical protein